MYTRCLNTLQFIAESGSYNNKFNFFISMNFPNLVLDSKVNIIYIHLGHYYNLFLLYLLKSLLNKS